MARKSINSLIEALSAKMDVHNKATTVDIKEIKETLHGLHIVSEKQQVILDEHIRRTEANERALELLSNKHLEVEQSIVNRLIPLEKHVSMWAGAGKVLAVIGSVAGIAYSIYRLLSNIQGI